MKRCIYTLAIVLAGIGTICSCDDVLDITPTDRFSDDVIWSGDETILDKYVIGLYGAVRDKAEIYVLSNSFTDAYSDIIKSASWDQYNHPYNRALVQDSFFTSESAGCFDNWSDSYSRILNENKFLAAAESHASKFNPSFLDVRKAEVRFLRAFSYYYLIRVYGGVVLRDAVDGPEQNDKARTSESESWEFVISDLRAAAQGLPRTWDDENYGRVTKAAAWGYLSRVALYYACSLKNAGSTAANEAYRIAIDAADSCAVNGGALDPSYGNVFTTQKSVENLMTVTFFRSNVSTSLSLTTDRFFRPSGDTKYHNGASVNSAFFPTSELVDSYEMSNGEDFSWTKHGSDPYSGREPRFYATVLYNGADWEGRKLQTYVGGEDGIVAFNASATANSTVTGYYFRKYITENDFQWEINASDHFWTVIRYAEVLLNKAEALAQSGDIGGGLSVLNEVRARVNLPAKSASNLTRFMNLLYRERMVELAGEGFRYWDLRRWRTAEQVINGSNAHGCRITADADGNLTYGQVEVDAGMPRIFHARYYTFSIPVDERNNNGLFGDNNPGW